MPGHGGAAGLLGRAREQAELDDALSAASKGDHQVVVVAGDAGAGKTTLVADVARRAEGLGFTVATGHCLDIGADISFAPVVEAVRILVDAVDDTGSRPVARRMRTVLDPAAPSSVERSNLLEDLRLTVLEAADVGTGAARARGPALGRRLDPGLRGGALADRARSAAVRPDRAQRRPAPPASGPQGTRRDRTSARRVARRAGSAGPGQHRRHRGCGVRGAAGSGAGPVRARAVGGQPAVRRGDRRRRCRERSRTSCPTSSSPGSTRWPRDRVTWCGPRPWTARGWTPTRSPRLAGVDRSRLDEFLHDLLDANVLRGRGDSLEFRHGLLREAVYDDLLPDERTRLHAELAAILQARVDADADPGLSLLSRLAYHWSAAHDLPRALEASVRAGTAATKLNAAEQVTHLERALSVWDRVPDAEAVAGCTRIELTLLLGQAARHAAGPRGVVPCTPGERSTCWSRPRTGWWRAGLTPRWRSASSSSRTRLGARGGDPPRPRVRR